MTESNITNEKETNSKRFEVETAIVGFIDILGYASLVERLQDNVGIINWLEKLIEDRAINFPERLQHDLRLDNPDLDEYRSKLFEVISIKVISDTILFTLYLDRIDFTAPEGTNFNPITDTIWTYFRMIEMFCLYFIAKTGHIFRGGVSIGKHYESNFDRPGNLFIFSTSYLNAFSAEKKAHKARIIIDDDLFSYLCSLERFDYIKEHLYKDSDEKYCIDIYSFVKEVNNPKRVLEDIKKGITANFIFNKYDREVLEKLNYFADYHNKYLSQTKWRNSSLYIDPKEKTYN